MRIDEWSASAVRFFFYVAFGVLAVASCEGIANQLGYTVVGGAFKPSRLLEYAAILLMFVVAILLRQIRDRLTKS